MQAARKHSVNEAYELYRVQEAARQRAENEKRLKEKKLMDMHAKRIGRTLKTISFFAFIFATLAVMILRYAALYEVQYKVNDISKEIAQTKMEIEEVKSNLDSTISLDNVERVAVSELGMQYPKPEQIVYIDGNWHYALKSAKVSPQAVAATNPSNDNMILSVYDYILKFASGDTNQKK